MTSDQQLISGLALLVSSITQLKNEITAYHWQMTIYLVWFSSFTHLATLTMLRGYMRDNTFLRSMRLFLMAAIVGLLVFALYPTLNANWEAHVGTPARCFFYSDTVMGSSQLASFILSILILLSGYLARVIKLFTWGSIKARYYLRTIWGAYANTLLMKLYISKSTGNLKWRFAIPYWTILPFIIIVRSCSDLFMSMIWEVRTLTHAFPVNPKLTFLTRLCGSFSPSSGDPFASLVRESL